MKLHPWFAGVDWPSLARQKVAFVPQPDCETDTSYFSSKPVSQRSLALDLDSSRSDLLEAAAAVAGVAGPPLSPGASSLASLASSRAHSRAGSKRASTRRRSLRQALAEPSGASFSELRGLWGSTLSHSSGASTTSRASPSRASMTGPPEAAVQPSAGSVVRAAAAVLQHQQASGPQQLHRLQRQQQPERCSTVLSGECSELPAGEPLAGLGGYGSAPLSGDEDEQLAAAAAAAFGSGIDARSGLGSGDGEADTEMVEVDDAASLSGSSASYASGCGSVLGSDCCGSGASSGSGLDMEQSLEALR